MSGHLLRGAAAVLAAGALLLASPATATSPPEAARAGARGTLTDFGFDAYSYGSRTTGNDNAASGALAASHFPCTRYVPRTRENFLATGGDGDGVSLSGVTTRNYTVRADRTVSVYATVSIDSGTLAGGQVGFENLHGVARSYHNASGFHSTTVSTVGTLTIGGAPVPLPDNGQQLEIPVPGSGTLFVNYTRSGANRRSAGASVNVLRFEADNGTIERVGRSTSRIDGQVEGGLFRGAAWASDAHVGDLAALGRAALQPIGCAGTGGQVRESSNATTSEPQVGMLGVRRSFTYGVHDRGSATGYTRSVVDNASFGGGVLQLDNIRAKADVTRQRDGDLARSAKGTGVGTILINRQQVPSPPAGEEQEIPGLGSFTVRAVRRTAQGLDVTGVIVRLENGTPADRSDDTIVNLARAVLAIKKG